MSFSKKNKTKSQRILSISDIHLGHPRVPSLHIYLGIVKHVIPKIPEVDIVLIGGDLFDSAVSLASYGSQYVIASIVDILMACHTHNKPLILLDGTKSHDRGQYTTVMTIYERLSLTNPIRFHSSVDINEICGIRYATFPDDLPYKSADEAVAVLKGKMFDKGWETVDYVFLHGYFQHKLPKGVPGPRCTFTPDMFPFVKKLALCGHDHSFSHDSALDGIDVAYNGSFDRLTHGQPEKKGFLIIDDYADKYSITFIENTDATPFITLDFTDTTDGEEVLKQCLIKFEAIDKQVYHHIRVIHSSSEVRSAISKLAKTNYPNIGLTTKSGTKVIENQVPVRLPDSIDLAPITEQNLSTMLVDFMSNYDTSPPSVDEVDALFSLLEEVA